MINDKISTLKLLTPLVVASGTPVSQVVEAIRRERQRSGCVLVYEGPRLVGIMTERDVLLKIVARDLDGSEPVDKFMTPDPITITQGQTIGEAINLMDEHSFRHIPVVDEVTGEARAIIDVSHIITYLAESFPEQVINLPPRPHQKMMTPEGA